MRNMQYDLVKCDLFFKLKQIKDICDDTANSIIEHKDSIASHNIDDIQELLECISEDLLMLENE